MCPRWSAALHLIRHNGVWHVTAVAQNAGPCAPDRVRHRHASHTHTSALGPHSSTALPLAQTRAWHLHADSYFTTHLVVPPALRLLALHLLVLLPQGLLPQGLLRPATEWEWGVWGVAKGWGGWAGGCSRWRGWVSFPHHTRARHTRAWQRNSSRTECRPRSECGTAPSPDSSVAPPWNQTRAWHADHIQEYWVHTRAGH
jgi:hypothetical protein